MSNRFIVIFLITLSGVIGNCFAGNISLTEAEIEVGNYSKESKINAIRDGLSQVLVKTSADPNILKYDAISSALDSLDVYVSKYFYLKKNNKLYLDVKYNSAEINKLLSKSNLNIPSSERPSVLAWVAIDDDSEVKILGNANFADLEEKIFSTANSLGMPVVLPMLDLTEKLSVSYLDLIKFDFSKVDSFLKNYSADAVLMGSVFKFNGVWQFKWKLKHNNKIITWFDSGNNLSQGMDIMLANVANKLLNEVETKTRLLSLDKEQQKTLKLSISGIDSLDNYAMVEDYLQQKFSTKINGKIDLIELADKVAVFSVNTEKDKDYVYKTLKQDNVLNEASDSINLELNTLDFKIGL